jgi:hypothetical protein
MHPAFKTLVSQPELLAEHAGAYAQLAAAEVGDVAARLRIKAALGAAAAACGALGLSLAGTALLLLAVVPLSDMPAPWALALAPGVPLFGAAGLWWAQRRRVLDLGMATLRGQIELDRALWRRLTEE